MLPCISTTFTRLSIRPFLLPHRLIHVTSTDEAARKGTREKARKKKVKVEVQKIGFIPHNQRGKDKLLGQKVNKHVDDSWKAVSTDNVWIGRYYRWRVYTIEEAIQCHRDTHHPTIYNVPDAPLNIEIELNMQGEKVTRFMDNFQRMAMIPHRFDHGEDRKIIVFAKGQELLAELSEAGASLVGGSELIKDIQNGELNLNDYDYYLAHPNILPELVSIRGVMRRKFPNPKSGTLGPNLGELVKKYRDGVQYSAVKDELQKDFGLINTTIGTLTMDTQHLKENLIAVLKDVDAVRPKREGKFVMRVLVKSPPSSEQLKIDPFLHIPEVTVKQSEGGRSKSTAGRQQEDEDLEDEKEAMAVK